MCCTAAREWQNADQEHQENDLKMRQRTNLQVFFYAECLRQRARCWHFNTKEMHEDFIACTYIYCVCIHCGLVRACALTVKCMCFVRVLKFTIILNAIASLTSSNS